MGRTENQKLKLLYLKELFERQSDEEHLLSMQDILDALAVRGIRAERKSVYDDILCLQQFCSCWSTRCSRANSCRSGSPCS